MSGYDVVISALRASAQAARSAGEQTRGVDLAGAVAGVPAALPGSRSARSAATLAEAWRAQITDWSAAAVALGDNMSAAADLYATNEQAAEQDLTTSRFGMRPI